MKKKTEKQPVENILYLNRGQSVNLGENLLEYAKLQDSSVRFLFEGFWIQIDEDNLPRLKPVVNTTPISDHNSGFEEE
tara:strand:- start:182 stop:415 length:234 start_codon:yes stop_codon:yes gene_type:complete